MYLKRVELYGFKSFADRTVFEMAQGITAVLGPNGCGKSNVVDAIKWVLGESSAKNLRGTNMQDVIFAGSSARKPLGMAEVSLIFDNHDNILPIDYSEVCVTRRLYRSGESEYEINQQPCLKRDIRDLFLDTGVGMSAYSFIEQGRVEALLQAKPAERRLVIEEAAGISKYKQRRKESLARLERTNQSLLRVNDIVEEIEKNVRKVSRQASNARAHQRLTTDLQTCKTLHYTRVAADFLEQLNTLEKQKTELDDLFIGTNSRQTELTNFITNLTDEEMTLTAKVEVGEKAYRVLQEDLNKIQVELAGNSEKREALTTEKNHTTARAEILREKSLTITTQTEMLQTQLTSAENELQNCLQLLNGQDGQRAILENDLIATENTINHLRQTIIEITARKSEIRAAEAQTQAKFSAATERLNELNREAEILSQNEIALTAQLELLRADFSQAQNNFTTLNQKVNELREREKNSRHSAMENNRTFAEMQQQLSALDSRRKTLQELADEFDGAYAGVKAVLKAKENNHEQCADVAGMVADILTVPQNYATAIETVLGGAAQDIITHTARGAQECIQYLKNNRAGRATFLPLDRISPRAQLRDDLLKQRGVIGEAFDLVEFADVYSRAVEYLLNGVLIVEDLNIARELAGGVAKGVRIVTLDGEVISPHGAMSGGLGNQQRGGIIARKAEKDALISQIAELQNELTTAQEKSTQLLNQAENAERERVICENELATKLKDGGEIERNLSVKENEYQRLLSDRTELTNAQNRLQAEYSPTTQENLLAEKTAILQREENATQELSTTLSRQKNLREQIDALGNELGSVREKRATAQSAVNELTRRLQEISTQNTEYSNELTQSEIIISRVTDELQTIQTRLQELHSQEKTLLDQRANTQNGDVGDKEKLRALREQLEHLRNEEKSINRKLNEIGEALNNIKVQRGEIKVRVETIIEKARNEINEENIIAVAEKYLRDNEPIISAATGEEIKRDFAPIMISDTAIETLTTDQMSEFILQIETRISRLGPVNMCAIEELAELEARAEFLQSEQDDIKNAANDLLQMIEKLNDECDKKFEDTFNAVKNNFQEMFGYLFGGGQAELILTAPEVGEDQLDRGIEIIARPPGKTPKSITLLSGGEKALCAVALLFAIFRSKPSPFCILDEVDGPLDESNIDRFMEAVRKFTVDTQFIIISHSKRTMSMVDTIYGVTQEQPGISTRYSLHFTNEYAKPREENKTEVDAEMALASA